ncbi:MAG: hypothetical protein H7Z38_21670, partial [Rubrivivax sp.]|nr:hypothetical protein [Pyrinomonadaceae bacterium]
RAAGRQWKSRALAESGQRRTQLEGREDARFKREGMRADVRLKHAQADYTEQRPEIEGKKIDAQALKQSQALLQREIGNRLKEPRKFDFEDDYDVDLLRRSQAAGMHVPTGAFGDYKNPASIEIQDPTDARGVRRTRLTYDRAANDWKVLTDGDDKPVVTELVEERGPDGVPKSKREQMEATADYRAQLLGLSTARLQEAMANGLTGRAAKVFSTKTTGLFQQRTQIETQINGYRTRASKREITPAESERRIGELQKKLDEVTGQIDDARSEAVGEMGGASRPRTSGTSQGKSHVSRAKFRAKYPQYADAADGEVDGAIRGAGFEPIP